jgi:hypothetical protein
MIDFVVMRDKRGVYIGTVCDKCGRWWERDVLGFPVTHRCLCNRADFGHEKTAADHVRRAAWERENARILRAIGTPDSNINASAHEHAAEAYEYAAKRSK